jgi:hypothetical protein
MNEKELRYLDHLLHGDSVTGFDKLSESVEEVQEFFVESAPKTFIEAFADTFDTFSEFELNESEQSLVTELEIDEELCTIQEALESIREKICLSESVAEAAPMLLTGLATAAAAFAGWLVRRKAGGESAIPRPLVNALHDIKTYVTKGNEKERRQIILNSIERKNPNLDKKIVSSMIDFAIKNADKISERPVPKNSAKHGTYETGFMQAQRERDSKKLATR